MADTIFGSGTDQWVCPNDRQLALRAKLKTGWSVHTNETAKQRQNHTLTEHEIAVILEVIKRAENLDVIEQRRIGRLVERLENMKKNVMGNGHSQCLLCGELLGFLGSTSVFCQDCRRKVCIKCGIETFGSQRKPVWLCKICSEGRELSPVIVKVNLNAVRRVKMTKFQLAAQKITREGSGMDQVATIWQNLHLGVNPTLELNEEEVYLPQRTLVIMLRIILARIHEVGIEWVQDPGILPNSIIQGLPISPSQDVRVGAVNSDAIRIKEISNLIEVLESFF
ncbi:rab effector Noc2-like isoform X3 [Hemitrygon akajei]|uniref:rab effector Noc2-like isoform X3 n=1 Tax=Hemitrygon akajei TaxID=2704970 RepID=UPI003BFA291D